MTSSIEYLAVGDTTAERKVLIAAAVLDVLSKHLDDEKVPVELGLAYAQVIATLALAQATIEQGKP